MTTRWERDNRRREQSFWFYFGMFCIAFSAVFALCCILRADEVLFTGDKQRTVTAAIVADIDACTKSVDYQLYNFTSEPIANALIRAHDRGCDVRIVLDKRASASKSCQARRCAEAGLAVYLDSKHPIAHNKVRIYDGKRVGCGSFNDSKQAERNAENYFVETDAETVAAFVKNFNAHLKHSEPLGK